MPKANVRAWAEEGEHGKSPLPQVLFEKSGYHLSRSLTVTVRDPDPMMQQKQPRRGGCSVKELPRPERTPQLKVNRKPVPSRGSSKNFLHRDESPSNQPHTAKPQHEAKNRKENRKATGLSHMDLDFGTDGPDLTLVMPGYREHLRALERMYETPNEEITTPNPKPKPRFSYMNPEPLPVPVPPATKKSRFFENLHLDITEPRPEKSTALYHEMPSELSRCNAIRRSSNTYAERRDGGGSVKGRGSREG